MQVSSTFITKLVCTTPTILNGNYSKLIWILLWQFDEPFLKQLLPFLTMQFLKKNLEGWYISFCVHKNCFYGKAEDSCYGSFLFFYNWFWSKPPETLIVYYSLELLTFPEQLSKPVFVRFELLIIFLSLLCFFVAIALSALRRVTASDYHFGIIKLFSNLRCLQYNTLAKKQFTIKIVAIKFRAHDTFLE